MLLPLLEALRKCGWAVSESREALPAEITDRYPSLPGAVRDFLESICDVVNSNETAWFVTPECVRAPRAFRWNEWELLSLAAAEDDPEWQRDIRAFWDAHFPLLLSVADGYAYVAVVVAGVDVGRIVCGREPEFEVTTRVAADFAEFQELLVLASLQPDRSPELAAVVGSASN